MRRITVAGALRVLGVNLVIVAVSAAVGVSLNRAFVRGPQQVTFEYSNLNGKSVLKQLPPSSFKRYPAFDAVGLEEARKAWQSKTAIFLDGRTLPEYQSGHIPAALHLAVADFEKEFPQFSRRVAKDTQVIVYCRGGDCTLSQRLAELLYDQGYTQLKIFRGGYNEWFLKENPVEKETASAVGSKS